MNIVVHCNKIEWDTDGEKVKLPKKCDINLDLDADINFEPNTGLKENIENYLENNLSELLSNEYGFLVESAEFTWNYDFNDIKKIFKKLAKKEWKKCCKRSESPISYDEWLEKNVYQLFD